MYSLVLETPGFFFFLKPHLFGKT